MKYVIELTFSGGVHFGSDVAGYGVEDVQGYAHSDTIFSALINTLASVRHQFEHFNWINDFFNPDNNEPDKSLPFFISSFGFVDINERAHNYFIPRPLLFPIKQVTSEQRKEFGKDFKKMSYISINTFRKWQSGDLLDLKEIVENEGNRQPFWIEEPKTQHITDSQTLSTQIFRTGLVFYKEGIKPFFIVELDEKRFPFAEFWKLLQVLKFNGLGGRRTTGCGLFELEDSGWFCIDAEDTNEFKKINPEYHSQKQEAWQTFREIFYCSPQNHYIFSTYFPTQWYPDDALVYRLVQRKGWVFSASSFVQLKRKTCFMFGEGSVFRNVPSGKLVDVTPAEFNEHKVFRYGIPFTIPFCEVTL